MSWSRRPDLEVDRHFPLLAHRRNDRVIAGTDDRLRRRRTALGLRRRKVHRDHLDFTAVLDALEDLERAVFLRALLRRNVAEMRHDAVEVGADDGELALIRLDVVEAELDIGQHGAVGDHRGTALHDGSDRLCHQLGIEVAPMPVEDLRTRTVTIELSGDQVSHVEATLGAQVDTSDRHWIFTHV